MKDADAWRAWGAAAQSHALEAFTVRGNERCPRPDREPSIEDRPLRIHIEDVHGDVYLLQEDD